MKKLSTVISIILILLVVWPFIKVREHLIENEKPIVETIEAYPEPDFAKVMFLGFNAFSADLLLTRAQYYFGSHYITDHTFPLLEQMTKVIMALNPDLKFVIKFAEAAISSMRTEAAIESANSLLRLGEELYPDDYFFVFNQGYNYYVYRNNMELAYPLMYKGARMEGAPERLFWLVTRVATMGGGYRLGYEYTKEKLRNAKDKNMKNYLKNELRHFETLLLLTAKVEEYHDKTGEYPGKELEELVTSGLITGIPEDVYGGEYYYDEKKGIVNTTSEGNPAYRKLKEAEAKKKKDLK